MLKQQQQSIETQNQSIERCDRQIKSHPDRPNNYYLKAGALVKLSEITGDNTYYDQALVCYNKAIDLSPQNGQYLADRSKLHIAMGNISLATQDVVAVQESPSMGKLSDMYKNHTMKDVLKLNSVQNEVNNLVQQGKITLELQGVFSNMIQVVSGISLRVSNHDIKLDEHDEEFIALKAQLKMQQEELKKLTKSQAQYPSLVTLVGTMSKEITILQEQVMEHDKAIEILNEQVANIYNKDEFEALAKRFEKVEDNQELFGGRLKLMQGTIESHSQSIMTIDQTLEQSNCFNKQTVRDGFEKLKVGAPNLELFNYANNFYWSLSNYLLAYRSIASGAVQGIRDKNKLEKIWDKVGSRIIDVTKAIPMVGGVLGLIEEGIAAINDEFQEMKFDRKVAKINELMTSYILEEDLNLAIASASIKIAQMKRGEILAAYQQTTKPTKSSIANTKDKVTKKIAIFEEKMDQLITKMTKISSTQETPAGKLAIKDVVLFLNYLATHEVQLVTKDNLSSLDKVVADAFTTNIGKDTDFALKKTLDNDTKDSNSNKEKCIIAKFDEVIYDNPLLNNEKLLQAVTKHFNVDICQALDLSESLEPTLMKQIIHDNDGELLLAGIMSLNFNIDDTSISNC